MGSKLCISCFPSV
jgi:hypothetical protein